MRVRSRRAMPRPQVSLAWHVCVLVVVWWVGVGGWDCGVLE